MTYDAERMAAIAGDLYAVHVERAHGPAGLASLRTVIRAVRDLYRLRGPTSFPLGLIVFATLEGRDHDLDLDQAVTLAGTHEAAALEEGAVVELLDDGRLRAWPPDSTDASDLVDDAVVYVFAALEGRDDTADVEVIVVPDGPKAVPNPVGYESALAPPTFWNLEEAIDYYAANLAARSTCKILKTVWAEEPENRRLVFKNHPETTMRESLAQHLRSSVRDAQLIRVNEEQNVSETEPVDIEVTWSLTSQIALIEVKWLGQCLNADGVALTSYRYSHARARAGARQLANYLAEFRERTPGHEIRGYLVVFDGRRRRVTTWIPGPITPADAWHFEQDQIQYQDSVPSSADFHEPIRLYLEPRIPRPSAAAAASAV